MIERDPRVRDHFLVLEPRESFGEYARAYGDALAEHYEDRGVIVIPQMPIRCDLDAVREVVFPPQWKKIGSVNRIEEPVVRRRGGAFEVDETHPFVQHFRNVKLSMYLQSQIAAFDAQLRHGLSVLFPRYRSMRTLNITWRLLETAREGMHLDVFEGGRPLAAPIRSSLRVKIFINIDLEPRRWRTSLDLPAILSAGRGKLPQELADDLNVVNGVIDRFGVLETLPAHSVQYGTMSAVLVNAEVVAHEVVYGRRMVAGEFAVEARDMLDPRKLSHASLRGWLADNGYAISADSGAVYQRHAHLKGLYQRLQEARAAGAGD